MISSETSALEAASERSWTSTIRALLTDFEGALVPDVWGAGCQQGFTPMTRKQHCFYRWRASGSCVSSHYRLPLLARTTD